MQQNKYNDYLENFYTFINKYSLNDYSLDKIKKIANQFDNPQDKIKGFTIYITGTNGKGSLVAFLRSIFYASNLKCNIFTSPHIKKLEERIVIRNEFVNNEELKLHLLQLKDSNLSYFEQMTLAAYMLFEKYPADVNIIEVGIGAKLDATNIISKVDCSVITTIGLDHIEYLGDTITKIATDKSYIMRKDAPCFVGKQNFLDATKTLYNMAQFHKANLFEYNKNFNEDAILNMQINLMGLHQIYNATLANAVALYCKKFMPSVTNENIKHGIENAQWPGRLELIKTTEYNFILDGAHNIDGAIILRKWHNEYIKHLQYSIDPKYTNQIIIDNYKKNNCNSNLVNSKDECIIRILVTGIKKTKNLEEFLLQFLDFEIIICTNIFINGVNFYSNLELQEALQKLNYSGIIYIANAAKEALNLANQIINTNAIIKYTKTSLQLKRYTILCTGSLFLVSNIYSQLNLDVAIYKSINK